MTEFIAWWGAATGTLAVLAALALAILRLRDQWRRLVVETFTATLAVETADNGRLGVELMVTNRSQHHSLAITEADLSFEPAWKPIAPFLLGYAANDDERNLELPLNLSPGEAKSGRLNFRNTQRPKDPPALPEWNDLEAGYEWARVAHLELTDSMGRKMSSGPIEIYVYRQPPQLRVPL